MTAHPFRHTISKCTENLKLVVILFIDFESTLAVHIFKRFERRRVSGRSNEKRIEKKKRLNLQMQPLHYANVTFDNCIAMLKTLISSRNFTMCTKSQGWKKIK